MAAVTTVVVIMAVGGMAAGMAGMAVIAATDAVGASALASLPGPIGPATTITIPMVRTTPIITAMTRMPMRIRTLTQTHTTLPTHTPTPTALVFTPPRARVRFMVRFLSTLAMAGGTVSASAADRARGIRLLTHFPPPQPP